MRYSTLAAVLFTGLCSGAFAQQAPRVVSSARPAGFTNLPRTAQNRPNFQGIWQAQGRAAYDLLDHPATHDMAPGKGVVVGGEIPYQPWAAAKKLENFANRKSADPLGNCYFPGVPRVMYLEFPFQIFQTSDHVAMIFEWSLVHRLIYTNGKPSLHEGIESWMGDARGRWEGDTLVVQVRDQNDKTWFDMAGNFHSDAIRVTERFTMLDANTIQYEATIDDAKVFTKPWKISVPLIRQTKMDRILEYQCQAEKEEADGSFERDTRTWYPKAGSPPSTRPDFATPPSPPANLPVLQPAANLRRTADGKPDLNGYYQADGGGANYGIERHQQVFLMPAGRGIVVDPVDRLLPYQPWTRQERTDRELPHRGYDDQTAHCFPAGVPRAMYGPSPFQWLQTPNYVVILFERMSWRVIPIIGPNQKWTHIPDNVRLWQGDSVGHWEGDTLVVETTNLNGKSWLSEAGDVMSHAAHVVERFVPTSDKKITYRATVSDPIAYTRPWTIEVPLNREDEELLEVACHEDNIDLQHLKDVRDEYRRQQKSGQ